MKKFFKWLISYEPLIIWFRYFLTLKLKYVIVNFVVPFVFCIIVGCLKFESLSTLTIDVFTISSIFIGFAISILVMILTTSNNITDKLKTIKLEKTNITLHQAMVYKFSFIIYNLIFLILFNLILTIFSIQNAICNLIVVFILMNSLLTIIEATSNVIFTLTRKDGN